MLRGLILAKPTSLYDRADPKMIWTEAENLALNRQFLELGLFHSNPQLPWLSPHQITLLMGCTTSYLLWTIFVNILQRNWIVRYALDYLPVICGIVRDYPEYVIESLLSAAIVIIDQGRLDRHLFSSGFVDVGVCKGDWVGTSFPLRMPQAVDQSPASICLQRFVAQTVEHASILVLEELKDSSVARLNFNEIINLLHDFCYSNPPNCSHLNKRLA